MTATGKSFDPALDKALDEALQESFPASDPPAVSTPDAPAAVPADHRPLSAALRGLHKALIDASTAGNAALADPFARLNAVMRDPAFAWLQPLSALIVEIDERGAEGDVTTIDMARFRRLAEGLLGPAEAAHAGFRSAYLDWLQRSPDVVLANRAVRAALR
ncbi:MAG: hypothetical protein AB7P02_08390 [Alphaproteobacteria bacterium]